MKQTCGCKERRMKLGVSLKRKGKKQKRGQQKRGQRKGVKTKRGQDKK